MPPKPKYTKEQIVETALEIVSQKGVDSLTAKEVGRALKTSTTPIFTVFKTMKELEGEVKKAAMNRFESFAHKTERDKPVFKQVGMQMILFAKEEPLLYRFLFMFPDGNFKSFSDIYSYLGSVANECLDAIQNDYGLTETEAKNLFEHTWIHTFGIGTMCATGVCDFSEEQISKMLTQDFTAMMTLLKSEKKSK